MNLVDALLISVGSLSAIFDLKVRRIPNWLIFVGAVSGIVLNGIDGLNSFFQSLAGLVLGILVLLLPFAFGWIGAGDVKFFGVIGSILGVSWLPRVFFYSALVAGAIAVIYVIGGSVRFGGIKDLWTDLKLGLVSLGHVMPEPVAVRSRERGNSVPWGVAFAIGTIIAYYFDHTGQWAGF